MHWLRIPHTARTHTHHSIRMYVNGETSTKPIEANAYGGMKKEKKTLLLSGFTPPHRVCIEGEFIYRTVFRWKLLRAPTNRTASCIESESASAHFDRPVQKPVAVRANDEAGWIFQYRPKSRYVVHAKTVSARPMLMLLSSSYFSVSHYADGECEFSRLTSSLVAG